MTAPIKTEHAFQAAVTEVLRLVIDSLYSNREIFLRELVSNASDAIDKRRFRAIAEPALLSDGAELGIRIAAEEAAGTLTISDDGIGMTEAELVKNLGTIAHSGTAELRKRLEEAKDAKNDVSLIGRFGVGFYSAFLVADRVEVTSRAGDEDGAFKWSSDGQSAFTVEPAERASRGTDVVLHLKADQTEYTGAYRLQELVRKYSDFVAHPISVLMPKKDEEAAYERINQATALWRRSPSEVTDAQYDELYQHLAHDYEPPLAKKHFKVEGTQEFSSILYIPKRPPIDMFGPSQTGGVRLHVKRVFVMEECDALLPKWLRFLRGVVDSEDLPLNVSRETLQDSRIVTTMRKQLVKRALDMIEELAATDAYLGFWRSYGAVLKEGLHFEPDTKDRLAKLLRFESTAGPDLVSLETYVSRMKPDQEAIYYVIGASRALVENAPHLEALKSRGFEVLLLTDPVDTWAMESLDTFGGKKLESAMDADIPASEKEKTQEETDALAPLIERMKRVLGARVGEVRTTHRLTESAACLVLPESGLPPYIERILRAQQGGDAMPASRRTLEINPDHPLVLALAKLVREKPDAAEVESYVELVYDQALLAEGSPLEDPRRIVSTLTSLLADAAGRLV